MDSYVRTGKAIDYDGKKGRGTQNGDILLFRLSGASAWSERGVQSELDGR